MSEPTLADVLYSFTDELRAVRGEVQEMRAEAKGLRQMEERLAARMRGIEQQIAALAQREVVPAPAEQGFTRWFAPVDIPVGPDAFAERLRALRERLGLSQAKLSRKCEGKPSSRTIRRWESGEVKPQLGPAFSALAEALDVPVFYLRWGYVDEA